MGDRLIGDPPTFFLIIASTCQTRVCRGRTLCSWTDPGQARIHNRM